MLFTSSSASAGFSRLRYKQRACIDLITKLTLSLSDFLLTMAFIFPEDKKDFTAANGVTYSWNGDKWVTKSFKADESALKNTSNVLMKVNSSKIELTMNTALTKTKTNRIKLSWQPSQH